MFLQNPDDLFVCETVALHSLVFSMGQSLLQNGLFHRSKVNNAFTVTGTAVAGDVAVVEAGLDLSSDAASLGIASAGQFGSGIKDNGVTARFVAKF